MPRCANSASSSSPHDRKLFKFLEGPPGPGVVVRRWGVTPSEGVVDAYEGYRAAGDRAQELRGAPVQVDLEHLERVTRLQQREEGLLVVYQNS